MKEEVSTEHIVSVTVLVEHPDNNIVLIVGSFRSKFTIMSSAPRAIRDIGVLAACKPAGNNAGYKM
jgi:hypothetical protein